MIYQYQIRLLIVIGESEWFLMVQKIISSHTTIILSILFPLAQWATIEMLSNSPPTFPIAPGEWATTKGTPCTQGRCTLLRHTRARTQFYDIPGPGCSLTTYPGQDKALEAGCSRSRMLQNALTRLDAQSSQCILILSCYTR